MARVGDVGLLTVDVAGFAKLTKDEKRSFYDAYLAAREAGAVYRSRLGPDGARADRIIRGILEAGGVVPQTIRRKIAPYAERFQLHGGPFDAWTGERFRPTFIPGELAAAAQIAIQNGVDLGEKEFDGAELGANQLEQLEAFLNSVRAFVFGPRMASVAPKPTEPAEPAKTVKTIKPADTPALPPTEATPAERDREALTAVADIVKAERDKDGTTPVKDDDLLLPFLTKQASAPYVTYLKQWLSQNGAVTSLMGYLVPSNRATDTDTRSLGFAAFVAVRDDDRTPIVEKAAAAAGHFELQLPGNAMFKRPRKTIVPPNAGAYHLTGAFGAMMPVIKPVFSLPMPTMRGPEGQRVLLFTNVLDAENKAFGKKRIHAFSASDEIAFRREKWLSTGRTAFLILKHVIGVQAGTRPTSASLPVGAKWPTPVTHKDETLAHLHADLVALHLIFDERTQSIGLVPEAECGAAMYDEYVSGFVEDAVPAISPDVVADPSVVARRIVVRYAIEQGAVQVSQNEGHPYTIVVSLDDMRNAVEKLLSDVQRMVSLADRAGFEGLLSRFGAPPPRSWQTDVAARMAAVDLPEKWTVVFPQWGPKRDKQGHVVDVTPRRSSSETGREGEK